MDKYWIAVDWGTTNFRAFLMHRDVIIAQTSHSCGLLSVAKTQFSETLYNLISPWLDAHGALPVVMAGMVGSQQGWHEVSYATLPATASKLLARAYAFTTSWGSPAWIIPGISGKSQFGLPDVMRGEEVQLLGLSALHPADEHVALLPGTHSKHAHLRNGEIDTFSTFMSGEVFSLLSEHSLLGRGLPEQHEDNDTFNVGVSTALEGAPFSHLIFSARARRLAGEITPSCVHSYISGLVIGYELRHLPQHTLTWVVGSPTLTARYQLAASQLDLNVLPVNGNSCFIKGLALLFSQLQGTAQ